MRHTTEEIWRMRRNSNGIGGYLVEFGFWMQIQPRVPTNRTWKFIVKRQRHFHVKKFASEALAQHRAAIALCEGGNAPLDCGIGVIGKDVT